MEKPPAAAAPAVVSDEDKAKIKKQVEFYFSDSNFPRDKFLRTEASKDPDGCISPADPRPHSYARYFRLIHRQGST